MEHFGCTLWINTTGGGRRRPLRPSGRARCHDGDPAAQLLHRRGRGAPLRPRRQAPAHGPAAAVPADPPARGAARRAAAGPDHPAGGPHRRRPGAPGPGAADHQRDRGPQGRRLPGGAGGHGRAAGRLLRLGHLRGDAAGRAAGEGDDARAVPGAARRDADPRHGGGAAGAHPRRRPPAPARGLCGRRVPGGRPRAARGGAALLQRPRRGPARGRARAAGPGVHHLPARLRALPHRRGPLPPGRLPAADRPGGGGDVHAALLRGRRRRGGRGARRGARLPARGRRLPRHRALAADRARRRVAARGPLRAPAQLHRPRRRRPGRPRVPRRHARPARP